MAKQAYVLNAKLDGWQGVRRMIAVRADQTLAEVHDALQAAFNWHDDHLYASVRGVAASANPGRLGLSRSAGDDHARAVHIAISRQALQLRLPGVPQPGGSDEALPLTPAGGDRSASNGRFHDGAGSQRLGAGVPSPRLRLLQRRRRVGTGVRVTECDGEITMNIAIEPEDEALIERRLRSGAFKTAEEVVHRALEAQEAEEEWLDVNRELIRRKIEQGVAELDRGEGIPADSVKALMLERKQAWLKGRTAR
jgi:antitoxin ParD1/3/4